MFILHETQIARMTIDEPTPRYRLQVQPTPRAVCQDASDIVLLDDNFSSVVKGMEQGPQGIFDPG